MNKKVLIVEDHPDCRAILVLHVSRMGNEALEAKNGEEAIRKALDERPDVVILDLGLPDISGIEVIVRLKQEPTTSHIPIILHTAWSHQEWQEEAFKVGVAEYLVKPAPSSILKQTIERLTNGNRR